MKKLLAIIVLGLMFSGNANAEIIELDKCISTKGLANLAIDRWDEKTYNENNTVYYKFYDQPKLINNNAVRIAEVFVERELSKAKRKKLIKEGFKKIKFKDKDALSIDTNSGTITTIFSYTDEQWNYRNKSNSIWIAAKKKFKQNIDKNYLKYLREMTKTDIYKFKITDYVSGVIIGYRTDQEKIYPNERYSIKIDLNKLQVSEDYLNRIHNNPMKQSICSNPSKRVTLNSSKKKENQNKGTFKNILGKIIGK